MAFGHTFFTFCEQNNFGKWTKDPITNTTFYEISKNEFHDLVNLNIVFFGTNGGLVLGKLHIEGGVHMIKPNPNTQSYEYVGEMEGWEYLSSPIINPLIGEKLVKLNESIAHPLLSESTVFRIPRKCKVIDTCDISMAIILLSNVRHFIVNRNATKKHIRKIMRIEKQ